MIKLILGLVAGGFLGTAVWIAAAWFDFFVIDSEDIDCTS